MEQKFLINTIVPLSSPRFSCRVFCKKGEGLRKRKGKKKEITGGHQDDDDEDSNQMKVSSIEEEEEGAECQLQLRLLQKPNHHHPRPIDLHEPSGDYREEPKQDLLLSSPCMTLLFLSFISYSANQKWQGSPRHTRVRLLLLALLIVSTTSSKTCCFCFNYLTLRDKKRDKQSTIR